MNAEQTVAQLATSFDGGGREMTRYELTAAQHSLTQSRPQVDDPAQVDWWLARIANRLHFMDTGQFRPDPATPPLSPAAAKAQQARNRASTVGILAVVVLLTVLTFVLSQAF